MIVKRYVSGDAVHLKIAFTFLLGAIACSVEGTGHCPCVAQTPATFYCGYKSLTVVPGCAQKAVNATDLVLEANQLKTLPAGVFDNLTGLNTLNLGVNRLQTLPAGVFDELTELNTLVLGYNQLQILPAGVFDKLTELKTLDLNSNNFSSLPGGVFDRLTNLSSLYLQSNRLQALPAGLLDRLTELQTLRLNHNLFQSLDKGVFDQLTLLKELNLQYNRLTSLPEGIFDKLTQLSELFLDSNKLQSLPTGFVDKSTRLTTLYLTLNQFRSFPVGFFDKLASLEWLLLDSNDLQSLPAGIFDKLTRLQHLYITNNSLKSLPAGVFDKLTNLNHLETGKNPWHCSPDMCHWVPQVRTVQWVKLGTCQSSCCTNNSNTGCSSTQNCTRPVARTSLLDIKCDMDKCSSSPCVNGGRCINQVNSFKCQCEPGFSGITCKIADSAFQSELTEQMVAAVSRSTGPDWESFADHLGASASDISDIKGRTELTDEQKSLQALEIVTEKIGVLTVGDILTAAQRNGNNAIYNQLETDLSRPPTNAGVAKKDNTNIFIIAGLGACFLVIGIILAGVRFQTQRKLHLNENSEVGFTQPKSWQRGRSVGSSDGLWNKVDDSASQTTGMVTL